MIAAVAASRREQSLALLETLVRAGRAGEASVQDVVRQHAAGLGTVRTVRYHPADVTMREEFASPAAMASAERDAVVVHRGGTGGGRSLVLFAHPDSELPPVPHRWTHDPFEPLVQGGRLSGWGVADDLAGVACMLEALAVVAASGIALAGDVTLASTPSKRHARGVCALLAQGVGADAALYLHPAESGAGLREIKAFTCGQVEFTVEVAGVPPPTTEPLPAAVAHRGIDPIAKAALVLDALRRLDDERGRRVHHPGLHAVAGRSTNLMPTFIAAGVSDRLSQPSSSCTLGAVLAFPPPETLASVQSEIEAALRAAAAADPFLAANPPLLRWQSGTTGAELPADHPLFVLAAERVAEETGERPVVNLLHSGSDIRHPMVQRAIPTIGLGPLGGDLSQNGRTGEWVDLEDYFRTVAAVAGIIAGWCRATEATPPAPPPAGASTD
jgi:acetylornithine deacetylase